MSWGYWGIVIGVGSLVMLFFATMAIVYSNHTNGMSRFNEDEGQETRSAKQQGGRTRAAA